MAYIVLMASTIKDDRLDLRLNKEQKRQIERAAAISGRNLTDFSVTVLLEESEQVIRREKDLAMSAEAWEAFNALLERPAQPVDGLASLLSRQTVFRD